MVKLSPLVLREAKIATARAEKRKLAATIDLNGHALGGIPALSDLRSVSRYGLSVVTAVFRDGTNIYFARQQVGERLREATEAIPARSAGPSWGPSRPRSERCTSSRCTARAIR